MTTGKSLVSVSVLDMLATISSKIELCQSSLAIMESAKIGDIENYCATVIPQRNEIKTQLEHIKLQIIEMQGMEDIEKMRT